MSMDSTSSKSERKGQPHKKKRFNIGIGEASNATLITLTQSSKLNKVFIVEFLIELGHKHGFLKKGWEQKLAKSLKQVDDEGERTASRERALVILRARACHKLAFGINKAGEDVWSCVAFNPEGVLKVRVLGKTDDMMTGKCVACGRDRDVREGFAERDLRISDLENKIQRKAKTSRKVPICNKGAILTQEGTAFKSCPKSSITVSVATYCKVLSGGLPCALYAEIELAEGPL